MTFRTSPRADEDIADAYVAGAVRHGVAQADRYQDGLFAAFQMLADNPLITRQRRELTPPVRIWDDYAAQECRFYLSDDEQILTLSNCRAAGEWKFDKK